MAHQIAALARQDQHGATIARLDERFHPVVGKVGNGQHIHHAPGLMRCIAVQRAADGPTHIRSRAIAAHHVAGADRLTLPLAVGTRALKRDRRGVVFHRWIHLHIDHLEAVVGFQPCRRIPHDVEK